MSEKPLSPLTWVGDFTQPGALPPISMDETGPTPLDERPADTGDGPFLWPTPPYAIYPLRRSNWSMSLVRSRGSMAS